MQEGIEPTISTIPLGCNNKIVSGDQPSTVSRNHPQHTISFSSKYDWIPCGVIATDSNHSLSFLSVNRNEGILVSLTGNFCGYPKAPSTPLIFWQLVCLPTLHFLSLLVIKFPPTHPTHSLLWGSQRYKFVSTAWSTLATHLPSLCLRDLFSLSDPWHSSHPHHIGRLRLNSATYVCL